MTDDPEMVVDATIEIKLDADSGYKSEEKHRICAKQWFAIQSILTNPKYKQQ